MPDPKPEPLHPRLRAVISDAYYEARNQGRTMDSAANDAATRAENVVKAWLADHAAEMTA